ncbi:glutamate racemase [Bradyrhizobium sp. G127]|uniref:glutamate racemase n=1 Tax=Bradyrhizobium sp. G127 TaxID=2904800 RepID=UPI001F32165F|nr:glutamate racemase [Bradyrhizobium sp. G127]
MSHTPTILVFDSGLGGLTVFREIVKLRPGARYVYVADDAYFPYGQHTEDEIVARVVPLVGDLIAEHRPNLVVIACNTASTLVMTHLREAYSVPFVGTVPAIKPACASSKTKRVSVLGTKGTVKREYTKKLIADFAHDCDVTLVGAENLASLAEATLRGERVSNDAIAAEIAPCFLNGDARTDTVVLACTHYPLLLDQMVALAPWKVDWIDPAPAIARRVSDLLGAANGLGEPIGGRIIFTSEQAPSPVLAKALMPFFGASFVS